MHDGGQTETDQNSSPLASGSGELIKNTQMLEINERYMHFSIHKANKLIFIFGLKKRKKKKKNILLFQCFNP